MSQFAKAAQILANQVMLESLLVPILNAILDRSFVHTLVYLVERPGPCLAHAAIHLPGYPGGGGDVQIAEGQT
jgi:hypothetical protein